MDMDADGSSRIFKEGAMGLALWFLGFFLKTNKIVHAATRRAQRRRWHTDTTDETDIHGFLRVKELEVLGAFP